MTKIEFIREQIDSSKQQTESLLKEVPTESWLDSPEILNTNLNWQIGHLILANYLHGIASISGANEKVRSKMNVPDYINFYGPKSNPLESMADKPKTEELLKVYEFIFELIYNELQILTENDLNKDTEIPNPSAKNKGQALVKLFEHQMWHNGQIAMLNRIWKEKRA